ncbi:hypothetical protein [Methylobacterium iners]|uniref:Lipoprotein n=1 Tax=Methylobacterium iners TaxID=418707 RepID=A0ABQ4S0M6_9HYPH|nr:hypothetical protein [Methylobacterium iners]GJD95352.1 hypothetical protein OCOJLMKI_2564 [Methylobacterium iners]
MSAALAALLTLAACESSVDRQRAAICRRVLPAVNPAEADIRILRLAEGGTAETVRIDYALTARPGRQFWAICRFGPGAELTAVTTERGAVSGASLYLMKRYYLDSPEAAAAEPAFR